VVVWCCSVFVPELYWQFVQNILSQNKCLFANV
jgi:hypothetical protein